MVEGDAQYDYLEDMIAGYEPVTQVCVSYNRLKMVNAILRRVMQTCVDLSKRLSTLSVPVPYLSCVLWCGVQVLRLLCLQSLTGGGIRVNKFDHLR